MQALSEGKVNTRYNYKGSQIPYRTSVVGSSATGVNRSTGMSASAMPGYTMMSVPNMASMSAPMMGGGASASQYHSLGAGPMAMPPQYSLQLPNTQVMYPQTQGLTSQGSSMMYSSAAPMGGGATAQVISPAQLQALMKTPGAVIQPQTSNWTQFGGVQQAMGGGYPSMPSYSGRPSSSSYIVDYSDGLNILDEPTGGTTYMPN